MFPRLDGKEGRESQSNFDPELKNLSHVITSTEVFQSLNYEKKKSYLIHDKGELSTWNILGMCLIS